MVEDSGGQFGSAGRIAEVADGTRDRLYLLGPRRIGLQIDADADHKRAYRAGFTLDRRFCEDAAQLASVHQHVVHPFDLRREAGCLLDGAHDRDRRRNGDERQVPHAADNQVKFLMLQSWPQAQAGLAFPQEEKAVEMLMEAVKAVRARRSAPRQTA